MRTLIRHIRSNAVAYVALFFALGGGGGYAIAATTGTSKIIHTCVVKKTGELLAKSRCNSAEKAVSLNSGTVTIAKAATPGLGAVSAYVTISASGQAENYKNATVQPTGTPGGYKVSVPQSVCPSGKPVVSVTAVGGGLPATSSGPANVAVASVSGAPNPQDIVVQVGLVQGGTYTPGGSAGAYVQVEC